MKQDYTMYIYKSDRRTKTGERRVSTTVWRDRDEDGMRSEVANLFDTYPAKQGYRFEWLPAMKTVRNLMTGKDVQIATDTPYCCDPSTERYWSM